ncbi:MAG: tetratricopeptide repeat protein [Chthonomonas sp.]|nr:tetratricopeptide repeat protein [Chthonomonas sp.]
MKSAHRIVHCVHCDLGNTLDSAFCRKCGQPLDPKAIEAAKERNRDLVKEGMKAVAEGRLAEGVLVAQSALEVDENCIEAWALLGEARERDRDYPAALTAYTKLAELDPASTVYPIKIEHLNLLLSQESLSVPSKGPNRAAAALTAVAATLIVGSAGIGLAWIQENRQEQPKTTTTQVASNQTRPTTTEGIDASLGQPTAQPAAKPQPDVAQPAATTDTTPDPRRNPETATRINAGTRPNSLPTGRGDSRDSGFEPITPDVRIEPSTPIANSRPNPGPSVNIQSGTVDEDPSTGPAPKANTEPVKKPTRPPVYEIKPSANQRPTMGGSQPIKTNSTPGTDPFKQAQEAFIAGRYESAVGLYQRALAAGGPAGRIYQRLGQCYERIGRKVDAIESYEKAISIFEASGGNSAALSACKQAVQVLRG